MKANVLPTSKAVLNMAVMAHLDHGVAMRGIKLREALPALGFEGTREVYATVDPMLKRAKGLADKSSSAGAELTPAKALEMLSAEYPDLQRSVIERVMRIMWR